jgi:hypothetical protein
MRHRRLPEITYYQWNIPRWQSSDTRTRLDAAGRGIFRELLDLCYVHGSIPKDEGLRATKAGCTLDELRRVWPIIGRHFHAHKSDRTLLVNDEINSFRYTFSRYISAQKLRGKRGGEAKTRGKRDGETKRVRKSNEISDVSSDGLSGFSDGLSQYNTTTTTTTNTTTNKIDTTTTTSGDASPPPLPLPSLPPPPPGDWPETATAIRQYFPTADDELVKLVVAATVRAYAAAVGRRKAEPLTDSNLRDAIHQAHFENQRSAGLFQTTVPRLVTSWVEEAIRDGSIH